MDEEMSIISTNQVKLNSDADYPQYCDVDGKTETQTTTGSSVKHERDTKTAENGHGAPRKKRKTRRGKSKRKQPYMKTRVPNLNKPEAPYNSNQFLLDDHCDFDNLDEKLLNNIDRASTSTANRTRDSSFSVDSDGEFYSSPDDEQQYLIQDFDYQYETVHAEHLNSMPKADLIQEYLSLEQRVEFLSNILRKRNEDKTKIELQMEIERLKTENDSLKDQNCELRSKLDKSCNSIGANINKKKKNFDEHSLDSESDSSSSSSSTSSSSSSDSSSNNCDNARNQMDAAPGDNMNTETIENSNTNNCVSVNN